MEKLAHETKKANSSNLGGPVAWAWCAEYGEYDTKSRGKHRQFGETAPSPRVRTGVDAPMHFPFLRRHCGHVGLAPSANANANAPPSASRRVFRMRANGTRLRFTSAVTTSEFA